MAYSVLSTFKNAHDDEIWACKWAAEGQNYPETVITGSLDSSIKLWRITENQFEEREKLTGHRMGILKLDVSLEHQLIASSGMEGTIRLWDLQTGKPRLEPIEGGKVECWGLAFRPNSTLIGTSAQQGKIRLFDINSGEQTDVFETRGKFIMSIHFSPNGKYVAAGSSEGMIYIFDLQANRLLHAIEAHGKALRSVMFSPDSQTLATGSEDGTIRSFNPTHGSSLSTISGHSSWITSLDFASDSARIASSSTDCSVRVWKQETRENLALFSDSHEKIVWDVSFDPSGTKLISVSADCNMVLYRTPKEFSR